MLAVAESVKNLPVYDNLKFDGMSLPKWIEYVKQIEMI